jgi:hypothetical protein
MQLLKYNSYADYVSAQTAANKRKIKRVWATRKDIEEIASYIRDRIPNPSFGICHGVRNGWEVAQYRSLQPGVEVIGTEISETATQFKNVIQWDFHEVKPEWLSNVDFIYTNSWDHSYDPVHALDQWMSCIKPTGRLFIEWSEGSNDPGTAGSDCFSATEAEYREIIGRSYDIETTLRIPGSTLKRTLRRLRLTRVVSFGMPKQIFVIRRRDA